jgi:hypothetical protein
MAGKGHDEHRGSVKCDEEHCVSGFTHGQKQTKKAHGGDLLLRAF